MRPIRIYVDLLTDVPFIEMHFYAINYLKRILTITSGEATHVACGEHIERVPLYQEYNLAPKSSSYIIFRRNLIDSEIRSISVRQSSPRLNSSYTLTAKAKYKRREYIFGPVSSVPIDGWINMKK